MTSATPKPRAGEHTKGPWIHVKGRAVYQIQNATGGVIGEIHRAPIWTDNASEANARRIVACVNYLEGFKTEDLEQRRDNQASLWEERDLLRERERELVEVLKAASEALRSLRNIMSDSYNRELAGELADKCDSVLSKHGR